MAAEHGMVDTRAHSLHYAPPAEHGAGGDAEKIISTGSFYIINACLSVEI
jgi:hypothetical protein